MGPDQSLTDVLSIERPGETWIAVDGGILRPLPSISGLDPGPHQILLLQRDAEGGVQDTQWVRVNVTDPMASGADAYPPSYVVDTRPPRLEPIDPPWIRPGDALPVSASDESGIASVTYEKNGQTWDINQAPEPWAVGSHTVTVTATDNAGNVSDLRLNFQVDDVPPTINVEGVEKVTVQGRMLRAKGKGTVAVTAEDAHSGVGSLVYRVPDGRWRGVRDVLEIDKEWTAIEFRARDEAGNETLERWEVVR